MLRFGILIGPDARIKKSHRVGNALAVTESGRMAKRKVRSRFFGRILLRHGSLVPNVLRRRGINRILPDVGGVVANPLKVLGDEEQIQVAA